MTSETPGSSRDCTKMGETNVSRQTTSSTPAALSGPMESRVTASATVKISLPKARCRFSRVKATWVVRPSDVASVLSLASIIALEANDA